MKYFLGLDIGGTHSKAGLMDEQGRLIDLFTTPTRAEETPEKMLTGMIESLRKRHGHKHEFVLEGVGMGLPGVLDPEKSMIREASNLRGWIDFPLKEFLQVQTSATVLIENDANMAALGEYWAGAGHQHASILMLTLGSGIGGSIIHQGQILEWNGFSSEIGHMVIDYNGPLCRCGKQGCLETYNGRYGLERLQKKIFNPNTSADSGETVGPLNPRQLSEKAEKGNSAARQVFIEAGEALGIGISNLLNLFRVDAVIIGGGIAGAWPGMLDQAEKTIKNHTFQLEASKKVIHLARLGDAAGVRGAGLRIRQEMTTPAND